MASSSEDILGYAVDSRSLADCLDEIMGWISQNNPCRWFACLNPHSCVEARKDVLFAQSLRSTDILIPDGIGIVMASHFLNGKIRKRITGADVFFGLQERLNQGKGYSVFFLGSTNETLSIIQEKMKVDYPRVKVAGSYSPPFKLEFSAEDTEAMVKAVNDSGADVLWVGMTAPKQEKWIFQNKDRLKVKFAGAIGAVFDFYAGRVKRAHPFFQKLGLEWLVRLVKEPRRLWRRYLVNTFIFLWCLLWAKLPARNGPVAKS
jgi:N-acetylglucosaminyldiphosphoundecaprenol N-acetyl-beta-D-mannosaminyltransferase